MVLHILYEYKVQVVMNFVLYLESCFMITILSVSPPDICEITAISWTKHNYLTLCGIQNEQSTDVCPSCVKLIFEVRVWLVFDVEVLSRETCKPVSAWVSGGNEREAVLWPPWQYQHRFTSATSPLSIAPKWNFIFYLLHIWAYFL